MQSFRVFVEALQGMIPVYRGLAGEYIPPGPQAQMELQKWNEFLDQKFGGDRYKEREYLKRINRWGRMMGLQRAEMDQAVTTNLQQAINYAKAVSQRSGVQPPIVVKVNFPGGDLQRYMVKSGGQSGQDVYDLPAEMFGRYFRQGGQILSMAQAMAELQRTAAAQSRTGAS